MAEVVPSKVSLDVTGAPAQIYKRDGSLMPFDIFKIREAIRKANQTIPYEAMNAEELDEAAVQVVRSLPRGVIPNVEQIQDIVEDTLIRLGRIQTAKAYIIYRASHTKRRQAEADLMDLYKEITFAQSSDADLKRENANIDGDTSMGTMLKYGSEGSKYFIDHYILPEDMAQAHANGDIHIHDKDFYMLTETCCQIDLLKLFEYGFSTGHGYLRQPQSIQSYAALCCIAIQANQNEMHGGQSSPNFDYAMAPGVNKTYRKAWFKALRDFLVFSADLSQDEATAMADKFGAAQPTTEAGTALLEKFVAGQSVVARIASERKPPARKEIISLDNAATAEAELREWLESEVVSGELQLTAKQVDHLVERTIFTAQETAEVETYQAMQALIHNLNTMNSRAGAQVPFSSINYGTDTSPAGRLVIHNLLAATRDGLGNGETPIFPVQIFKVKEGVNYNPGDPNYDLFKEAMATSALRLFPNFSFLDAPYNKQYYREGDYNTEVAYMGCRTRVMANVYDPENEVTCGRGNLSFTSINLPRLGIEARGNLEKFYRDLDACMDLVFRQLLHRFNIQAHKTVRNYPFLMGQGVWLESDSLRADEEVGRVLRHGTLTVGFIGLAETLKALTGQHHGESPASQELGLAIVRHMRERCDRMAQETKMNFTLIATPAEGLSGRFVRIDKEKYGEIPGVTDRDYYTNSFHIPVYFPIQAAKKIALEAPYHALTNAGHITYVEMDGDTTKNLEAFEKVIRWMKEQGVGYGSVNHPVDRDPVCGYIGIIDEVCPRCGRRDGEGLTREQMIELKRRFPQMPDAFCAKI